MSARILIIEDTPHNLELMTFLLRAHSHTVVTAGTGEEGVDLARQARPDLVVMDLQLPGIDGYQALETLRSDPELTAVPVIAVTSFAMVGDRDRALAAGFDHYLTKPIQPEAFAEEINTHLPERLRGSPRVLVGAGPAQVAEHTTPEPDQPDAADILVLDDSPTNQALLRGVLEPSGYRVRTAFTVEEAISAAEEGTRPDLVLFDVHVGAHHGAELLSRLRAQPALAVVPFAFTSSTLVQRDPQADEGHAHLIRRPIEPAALLREVEILLHPHTGD